MTASDDFSRDDSSQVPPESLGETGEPVGRGLPPDEEAAWREIVANYGERARLGEAWNDPPEPAPPTSPQPRADPSPDPSQSPRPSLFDRSFLDATVPEGPARHDEDHFVPPTPPPLPRGTPARRLAWLGVLLPPVLMFVAVLVRWPMPTWLSLLLVLSFLGGFVFLVATMPRDGGDDWDDGAVV